jgi:ATP-dependent exoDNAse (exonuclease V) beta subunit
MPFVPTTHTPDPIQYLATKNAHPRDKRIEFDEGPHVYTIDGDSSVTYTSVTTWNHTHFEHFDADKIIDQMMAGPRWPQSKYYGQTKEQIKKGWAENGREASSAGTKMHLDIEYHYNGAPRENDSVEYAYFRRFAADHAHLVPYRTEWCVFDEELRLSGSIDMVFQNPDGTLAIYDWKRSKEIVKTSPWMKFALTPEIEHLPDTNFWHYSLQLNIYKYILERRYGVVVTELFLVCLHPNNANGSYQKIKVPILSNEVESLVAVRRRELTANCHATNPANENIQI